MPPKRGGGKGKPKSGGRAPFVQQGLTKDDLATLRNVVAEADRQAEKVAKRTANKELKKMVAKQFNAVAKRRGVQSVPVASSSEEGPSSDSSDSESGSDLSDVSPKNRTAAQVSKAAKRKAYRHKLQSDSKELAVLKKKAAKTKAKDSEIAALQQQVERLAKTQEKMLSKLENPRTFRAPSPRKSANSGVHVSSVTELGDSRRSTRKKVSFEGGSEAEGSQSVRFGSQTELDDYVDTVLAKKLKEKEKQRAKPDHEEAGVAKYLKQLESTGRLSSKTDLLETQVTVVEWLAPEKKREFLEALEADAMLRASLTSTEKVDQLMSAAKATVMPQTEHVYENVLGKKGKSELLEICERVKIDPILVDGLSAKQLLMVLLSVVRVLPRNL